jgi:protein-disulfide isomerase
VSRRLLIGSIGAAVVLAGALAAVLVLTTGGSKSNPASGSLKAVSTVQRLLAGVPQQGQVLGSPKAPVTLIEFADLQCPYCGLWAREGLPGIVNEYVRTGKVRIVFNGMAFVGADSETALRTALAAGRQNRFWNVLELLFENQGAENVGWVTESLLRSVGEAVPGLDVQEMLDARTSNLVDQALANAAALASEAGVNSTPSFAVGKTGSTLQVVQVTDFTAAGLAPSIDAALAS